MYSRLRFDRDFRRKRENLLASGKWKLNQAGKICRTFQGGAWKTPWIFLTKPRRKYCGYWNDVFTQEFELIPMYCRFNCWKTVIKPPTVKGLFHLYEALKQFELPSKCGMDLRTYTYGAWAGFIYGDSLAQGRRYYNLMREVLPGDFSMILKRGCTEMEKLKPSNEWDDVTENDLLKEEWLNDSFEFEEADYFQSEWLKQGIKEKWIERAIEIGDPTAREMAETMSKNSEIWPKLVVESVTYHEEPADG